ncbi:effector from type III secretion system family protein, partial [Chlamydia psittaci 84-8471/1]
LFTQIQSDQQNYTTQGQTQQLNLQNQMTNVQQEWTLVSTSMQVLNQILSKLVGEIYPN